MCSATLGAAPGPVDGAAGDLCYATTNRQDAVQAWRSVRPAVGGRLRRTPRTPRRWFGSPAKPGSPPIGSTARAWSTPPGSPASRPSGSPPGRRRRTPGAGGHRRRRPDRGVDLLRMTEEDEYFPLPPSLRRLATTLQALVKGSVACRSPGQPGPSNRIGSGAPPRHWSCSPADSGDPDRRIGRRLYSMGLSPAGRGPRPAPPPRRSTARWCRSPPRRPPVAAGTPHAPCRTGRDAAERPGPPRRAGRRAARTSGRAVRNTLVAASGKTTVPMSRPSTTASPPCSTTHARC